MICEDVSVMTLIRMAAVLSRAASLQLMCPSGHAAFAGIPIRHANTNEHKNDFNFMDHLPLRFNATIIHHNLTKVKSTVVS